MKKISFDQCTAKLVAKSLVFGLFEANCRFSCLNRYYQPLEHLTAYAMCMRQSFLFLYIYQLFISNTYFCSMDLKNKITGNILILLVVSLIVSLATILPELSVALDNEAIFEHVYQRSLLNVIAGGLCYFAVTIILFLANSAVFHFNDPSRRITLWHVLLSFLFIYAGAIFLGELSRMLVFSRSTGLVARSHAVVYAITHPMRDFVTAIVVFSSSYAMYLLRRQHLMTVENQKLATENARSQYESLKSQLNPHMLFNSLNTLSVLVDESPDKAKNYIHELSSVLRYSLQESGNRTVDLAQEMAYTDAYIYLQKMRYEDSLQFNICISDTARTRRLPPMSLQLLIENAVKHNRVSSKMPLAISIVTETDDWLVVRNHIQPRFSTSPSEGVRIGLYNLDTRYKLLYGRGIVVERNSETFCVRLPLIRPGEEE